MNFSIIIPILILFIYLISSILFNFFWYKYYPKKVGETFVPNDEFQKGFYKGIKSEYYDLLTDFINFLMLLLFLVLLWIASVIFKQGYNFVYPFIGIVLFQISSYISRIVFLKMDLKRHKNIFNIFK